MRLALFPHTRIPAATSSINYHRHLLFGRFIPCFPFPRKTRFLCHTRWTQMDTTAAIATDTNHHQHRRRLRINRTCGFNKILVIMGPTGAGKSRLSIDLATRFFSPAEIINTDKIQVYRGLDITTNKITMPERRGVPHHLLGDFDPSEPELTPFEFRSVAAQTIAGIKSRGRLPLVVGGSNSFIYGLLAKRFDPDSDVFSGSDTISTKLRYNCCFLWVDVSLPVLNQYLCKRVDEMMEAGMFEELFDFYESGGFRSVNPAGLGRAIGVPEFETYFKKFRSGCTRSGTGSQEDVIGEAMAYEEAVRAIKDNTCQLAKRQVEKIQRLREAGWDLRRIDATEAFRAALAAESDSGDGRLAEIWEKQVVEPSVKIVKRFLEE